MCDDPLEAPAYTTGYVEALTSVLEMLYDDYADDFSPAECARRIIEELWPARVPIPKLFRLRP